MNKHTRRIRLDGDLYFGTSLFVGDVMTTLERLLNELAPRWCRDAYIHVSGEARKLLRMGTGSLSAELRRAATETATTPFYRQLEETFGGGTASSQRAVEQIEIRSSDPSLVLVINADQDVVAETGRSKHWANSIAIQVRRSNVETTESSAWLRQFMLEAAKETAPAYGRAQLAEEFEQKNIVRDGGYVSAVGVDFANGLPSLYWLNIFGPPYIELIGREKLLASPAGRLEEVGETIALALAESPFKWQTDEYRTCETAALSHIGPEYFFSKETPNRKLSAPAIFSQAMSR